MPKDLRAASLKALCPEGGLDITKVKAPLSPSFSSVGRSKVGTEDQSETLTQESIQVSPSTLFSKVDGLDSLKSISLLFLYSTLDVPKLIFLLS